MTAQSSAPETTKFLANISAWRKANISEDTKRHLAYVGLEDMILSLGMAFKYQPLPPEFRFGREGQCYMNAYRLALAESDQLAYCEGYAFDNIFPMEHAWCVNIHTGVVYDNTWRVMPRNRADEPAKPREYFGIAFTADFIIDWSNKTGVYGVFSSHRDPLFLRTNADIVKRMIHPRLHIIT